YRPRKVLDRQVRLAEPDPRPATDEPRRCQVRIERERAVDATDGSVEIVNEVCKYPPAIRKRNRVVLAEVECVPRQPCSFGNLARATFRPPARVSLRIAPCRCAVGRAEARVELGGLVEQPQRLLKGLPRPLIETGHAAQIVIIRIEAVGRLALGAVD